MYANKKVTTLKSNAQQNAKIIANVQQMLAKNVITIANNEVLLYLQIWTDKQMAINWMKCLAIYCNLKLGYKTSATLIFKNIETSLIIGSVTNKTAKLMIELT